MDLKECFRAVAAATEARDQAPREVVPWDRRWFNRADLARRREALREAESRVEKLLAEAPLRLGCG
jgi:hypothetical protein